MEKLSKTSRCLVVAFAGMPNVGKSSLFNKILGEKLSIVSPRQQTTRNVIRGILVEQEIQIVFLDTPGIFIPQKSHPLEKIIIRNAWNGLAETDLVCILLDVDEPSWDITSTIIRDISHRLKKIVFILNKVDLVTKDKLLPLAKQLESIYPSFQQIFMVSALSGENVWKLKNYLFAIAPQRPWVFPSNCMTDAPQMFLAAEITREQLFLTLRQDLPYVVQVRTESWEKFFNGSLKIQQTIEVLRPSQKAIIIGKSGTMLRHLSMAARKEMEKFFACRIHLFIFVRVHDWIRENNFIPIDFSKYCSYSGER